MPINKFSATNITIDGTASTAPIDFFLGVQRNIYAGLDTFAKFGYNPSVSNSVYEPIWYGSSTYTYPSTANTLTLVSTSATDTAGGAGARTVKITGLDSNFDILEETIALNGTTNVITAGSFIRVNRVMVQSSGASGTNAGDISVTHNGTATLIASVPQLFGVTQQIIYTVPNQHTLFIYEFASLVSNGKETNTQLLIRDFNTQTTFVREFLSHTESTIVPITPLLKVEAKSDIVLLAKASTGSHQVSGFLHGVLLNETLAVI